MIRLYVDEEFKPKQEIRLPKDEWHYFKKVRRGRGEAMLFNRLGQEAYGKIDEGVFFVEEVRKSSSPPAAVYLALGLPDNSVLKRVIPQLSEIGIEELILFSADRSQSPKQRLKNISSFEKSAVESARQCERSKPLIISTLELEQIFQRFENTRKIFLDESSSADRVDPFGFADNASSFLMFVGAEGGWSSSERALFKENAVQALHLDTAILRVETAVVCAALLATLQMRRAS